MKRRLLIAAIAATGWAVAEPVVSPAGVRAELKSGASPLFEPIGHDADALPLDWPAAATKAKVTVVLNGRTNEVMLTDRTAGTLSIAAPAKLAEEAQLDVTVAYCDATGIARRTDRAVVTAVTGLNGAATRFNAAASGTEAWGRYAVKAPVIQTLAADDAVTRDGAAVGASGSFYRAFPAAALQASNTAGLEAADASYAYSVGIVRTGTGFFLFVK